MNPIIIAIAGGSGAGKSTLSHTFADTYPEQVNVLHLDDYRKEKESFARVGPFINWEHPNTIYWKELEHDMYRLKDGVTVVISKRNERFDRYALHDGAQSRTITPKRFVILDGYLALWNPQIRQLCDFSLFLDVSHDARIARRKKFNDIEDSQEYYDTVLIPMHNQFVEPTKEHAQYVWDVEALLQEDVFHRFDALVRERYGL